MLANRLGLKDVDLMLEEMGKEAFDERYVCWKLEPWGNEWMLAGAVATSIINEIRVALNVTKDMKLKDIQFKVKDWVKIHNPDFHHKLKRKRKSHVPIRQAEQHFAGMYLAKD